MSLREPKRQGGGTTSGTPPRKAFLPEDSVLPSFTEPHTTESAFWLRVASVCLFPALPGFHIPFMEPEDLQPSDREHPLFSRVKNVAPEILPVKDQP